MTVDYDDTSTQVDPDPFVIGAAVMSAVLSGAGFLETRRQRQLVERQERNRFRAAWFDAHRSTLHLARIVDEFETYVLEERLGGRSFRFGGVRLMIDRGRQQGIRRLYSQALVTAQRLGATMDDLSAFLGPEDTESLNRAYDAFEALATPQDYSEIVAVGRRAVSLYLDVLTTIDEREQLTAGA